MKPMYVRSEKIYAAASVFEGKKILAAAKRLKNKRKLPTSIALEEGTISELKTLAEWRGVPYQVLMRMFILDGLRKCRDGSSTLAEGETEISPRSRRSSRR